jgi:hypothetical protein
MSKTKKIKTKDFALLKKNLARQFKKSKKEFVKNHPHAVEFFTNNKIELERISYFSLANDYSSYNPRNGAPCRPFTI